jgi:hypothetical protein
MKKLEDLKVGMQVTINSDAVCQKRKDLSQHLSGKITSINNINEILVLTKYGELPFSIDEIIILEDYIGQKVIKMSSVIKNIPFDKLNPIYSEPKSFKNGDKINTVKDIINHPILNIPAFTFIESEGYVECRRIKFYNKEQYVKKNII